MRTNTGAFVGGVTLLSFPPSLAGGAVSFIGLTQDMAFKTRLSCWAQLMRAGRLRARTGSGANRCRLSPA